MSEASALNTVSTYFALAAHLSRAACMLDGKDKLRAILGAGAHVGRATAIACSLPMFGGYLEAMRLESAIAEAMIIVHGGGK